MQKMFVIHYYINKQILDSYLHTKSEKIWLLFTFVLNWVFLRFPWQRQAFWNFQASKPFIHMPYNISIKLHPIPSSIANQRWISIHNIIIYLETKFRPNRRIFVFWQPFWIQNGRHSKPTMNINSQHHNLLGNKLRPNRRIFIFSGHFVS